MGEVCLQVDPLCPFIPLCGGLHMDHSKLLREPQVVQSGWLLPHVHPLDCDHQLCHGDDRCSCRMHPQCRGVHHGTCGRGHRNKRACEWYMHINFVHGCNQLFTGLRHLQSLTACSGNGLRTRLMYTILMCSSAFCLAIMLH